MLDTWFASVNRGENLGSAALVAAQLGVDGSSATHVLDPDALGSLAATVAPAILAMLPGAATIRFRRVKCFGAGESAIEAMLPDLVRRVPESRHLRRICRAAQNDARRFLQPEVQRLQQDGHGLWQPFEFGEAGE